MRACVRGGAEVSRGDPGSLGATPLAAAAEEGRVDTVRAHRAPTPAPPAAAATAGRWRLTRAGSREQVEALLALGARPAERDVLGLTPLHRAAIGTPPPPHAPPHALPRAPHAERRGCVRQGGTRARCERCWRPEQTLTRATAGSARRSTWPRCARFVRRASCAAEAGVRGGLAR